MDDAEGPVEDDFGPEPPPQENLIVCPECGILPERKAFCRVSILMELEVKYSIDIVETDVIDEALVREVSLHCRKCGSVAELGADASLEDVAYEQWLFSD